MPATLHTSSLNTPDAQAFNGRMVPGAVAADAPLIRKDGSTGWLLEHAGGEAFTALVFGIDVKSDQAARAVAEASAASHVPVRTVVVPLDDAHALAAQRYDAEVGTVYLLRPDQHVCARWREPDVAGIRAALDRALAWV